MQRNRLKGIMRMSTNQVISNLEPALRTLSPSGQVIGFVVELVWGTPVAEGTAAGTDLSSSFPPGAAEAMAASDVMTVRAVVKKRILMFDGNEGRLR